MKQKSALIITLFGDFNYGNKLQNYALECLIKKNGWQVETARVDYVYKSFFMNCKKNIKRSLDKILFDKKEKEREKKFKNFNIEYLHVTKEKYKTNHLKNKKSRYNIWVYGSDQIWNPSCFGDSELFQGYYNDKNVTYAASYGINELPNALKIIYKKGLDNFQYISVREYEGVAIVNDLDKGKPVNIVLDPTMMLDKDEWEKLIAKPRQSISKRGYVLCVFLQELDEVNRKFINECAKEIGVEVIFLMEKTSEFYASGPQEFLYLIKNALKVYTDSFHATVFSIIFRKPFYIFERKGVEDMSSRISTLLQMLDIKVINEDGIYKCDLYENEYDVINEKLNELRKDSDIYLKKILKTDRKEVELE